MSEMEEVVTRTPATRDDVRTLFAKWMAECDEAHRQAAELRPRVARGQQIANQPDLSDGQRTDVLARLEALREALRQSEWKEMLGMALATAHGVSVVLNKAAAEDGWKPPEGSLVRVYMPGIANVTVKVDGYGTE